MQQNRIKHGKSHTRVWRIYRNMMSRCYNNRLPSYSNYGGRGIEVCSEWKSNFKRFYLDMGEPPSSEHSIDRIDNRLGYYKENCRWATRKEQANNCRNSVKLSLELTSAEWGTLLDISPSMIRRRMARGWKDPKEILLTPARAIRK